MVASAAQGCDTVKKKRDAQVYLEEVELIDARIKNKLIEQTQWRDVALGITANMEGERVKSSTTTKSKMADAVAKCVDIEREIDSLIDILIDKKKDVIQTLEKLDNATEYKLLHLRYIQYVPLKDIADTWGWEYTNVTTTHGRALNSVQRILDRRKKCDM
jgi:RNase H-fold protein (predicted Holliday junction resolvase)